MKTLCTGLLALLLLPNIHWAQERPSLPHTDRVRLAEAFRLADAVGNRIWPEWDKAPFAVLLVTPDREFLVRHPKPSDDFSPCGEDLILKCAVWHRPRKFPVNFEATFPAVDGINTIVIGQAENTASKTSTRWVITLLHEHFHQLQTAQPRHYVDIDSLGLARGDQTGMWMLNFPFPYGKPEVRDQFALMSKQLGKAMHARDWPDFAPAVTGYLEAKQKLRKLVGEDNYKYLNFQLWQEGIARYTEYHLARRAASDAPPGAEFKALKDFRSYHDIADEILKKIETDLASAELDKKKREVVYSVGAAEGLVLDTAFLDWRKYYFTERFSLDQRLGRVLGEPTQPHLIFKPDGADLLVSMKLEIPDAPHVVWTHAALIQHGDPFLKGPRSPPKTVRVELNYFVFSNRDDPILNHAGKTKTIEIVWRVAGHKKEDVPYHVQNAFFPSAAELIKLGPQLQKLGEEGERRKKSREFAP